VTANRDRHDASISAARDARADVFEHRFLRGRDVPMWRAMKSSCASSDRKGGFVRMSIGAL
jgi:hypothetical protein